MSKNKISAVSYKIEDGLYLVQQSIAAASLPKAIAQPTNHIACVDCSGSMTSDLPRIRDQLKRKLPKQLHEGDTFSLIWFSGRSEFGVLLEAEPVATLTDLDRVNKAIDRWLRPTGLTGFKEPLIEVAAVIQRTQKKNSNPFALFFMSDGCDNQWPRSEILKAVEQTAGNLAAATFVEYGYHADRALLSTMAEKAGGTLIFAEAFDNYEPVFEAALQKQATSNKRIEVEINTPIGGFAYSLADDEITTYSASAGKVVIPEGTPEIFYLSPTVAGDTKPPINSAAYAAMSLFAVRMKPEIVYPILKALGDVRFINMFSVCFGKQKYSEFMDAAKHAAFNSKLRYAEGYDPNKVPNDNAFTVLDLLRVLSNDDSTRLLLEHPAFRYSRISRGRLDIDENLTADEQLQLEVIRSQMAGEKSAKRLKELQTDIDKLLANKQDALRFVADPAPNGHEISGLVYNECSPNISIRVKRAGHVDLTARSGHADHKIPAKFSTHTWRNYAIVSHGLVNIDKLPVKVSMETYQKLIDAGVEALPDGDSVFIVNVKALPIINRSMVTSVSARTLIELEWQLTKKRARQKVFKHHQSTRFPGARLRSFTDAFGAPAATWLQEQGLTANGFQPRTVQAESSDFIFGKELNVKLKGYSTLPSIDEATAKMRSGKKLTGPTALMAPVITEIEEFLRDNPTNVHEKWLTGKMNAEIAETRGLIYRSAQIRFGIIVGQTWFQEFASLDENTMTVTLDGQDITGVIELREIQIKV